MATQPRKTGTPCVTTEEQRRKIENSPYTKAARIRAETARREKEIADIRKAGPGGRKSLAETYYGLMQEQIDIIRHGRFK